MQDRRVRHAKASTIPVVALLLLAATGPFARQGPSPAPLALASDDARLVEAFSWAARQASAYAFDGDAVGPWFEAALPGREAFCMRDVAHQAMGGHALRLQAHVRNMLTRFASGISPSRDWCSLWEIDRRGRPAHADYRNDRDFWYNLPANFDILDAAYGCISRPLIPRTSLTRPCWPSMTTRSPSTVERWGLGLDAVMTRPRLMNRPTATDPDARFSNARGIPGYDEDTDDFVAGLDLLAAQHAGFTAYARLQEARGDVAAARQWLRKAADVKALINGAWWDEASQGFFDHLTTGHVLAHRGPGAWNSAVLYWPVATDGIHLRAALDSLVRQIRQSPSAPIEEQSHHPEVLYRYGAADVAYNQIMDLTRPDRARREYPEVSFSVVGAFVTGLSSVSAWDPARRTRNLNCSYFADQFVMTMPRLTPATAWAELRHLPVRANDVTIRHEGVSATDSHETTAAPPSSGRAAFPGVSMN